MGGRDTADSALIGGSVAGIIFVKHTTEPKICFCNYPLTLWRFAQLRSPVNRRKRNNFVREILRLLICG